MSGWFHFSPVLEIMGGWFYFSPVLVFMGGPETDCIAWC